MTRDSGRRGWWKPGSKDPRAQLSGSQGSLSFSRHERIELAGNPEFSSEWLSALLKKEPELLGLGDIQWSPLPGAEETRSANELSFLDPAHRLRYDVSIRIGVTDEVHIVEAIETWGNAAIKEPESGHVSVLVAERFGSRFRSVLQLFSKFFPLVVLKMQALRVGQQVLLDFVTVIDAREDSKKPLKPAALPRAPEASAPNRDARRLLWVKRSSVDIMGLADRCLELLDATKPEPSEDLRLSYRSRHVSVKWGTSSLREVILRPRKEELRVALKLGAPEVWRRELGRSRLPSEVREGWLTFRLHPGSLEATAGTLKRCFSHLFSFVKPVMLSAVTSPEPGPRGAQRPSPTTTPPAPGPAPAAALAPAPAPATAVFPVPATAAAPAAEAEALGPPDLHSATEGSAKAEPAVPEAVAPNAPPPATNADETTDDAPRSSEPPQAVARAGSPTDASNEASEAARRLDLASYHDVDSRTPTSIWDRPILPRTSPDEDSSAS